jgi:hypothetical protein
MVQRCGLAALLVARSSEGGSCCSGREWGNGFRADGDLRLDQSKTAQIYVEKANKRRTTANAFDRREQSSSEQNVSLLPPKNVSETNEGKGDE